MVSFQMKDGVVSDIVGDESEVEMIKDTLEFQVTDDYNTYSVGVWFEDNCIHCEGYGDEDDMIHYTTQMEDE